MTGTRKVIRLTKQKKKLGKGATHFYNNFQINNMWVKQDFYNKYEIIGIIDK